MGWGGVGGTSTAFVGAEDPPLETTPLKGLRTAVLDGGGRDTGP